MLRPPVAAVLLSVATVLGLVCAGCSSTDSPTHPAGQAPGRSGSGAGSGAGGVTTTAATSVPNTSCPASYVSPDPSRPQLRLTFDAAADLRTVTGTEQVRFVPDLPVRELVFRLTANSPSSVDEGNSIRVTAASADPAGAPFRVEPAAAPAGTQGGLLVIPLGRLVPAGVPVTARVAFRLRLGDKAFDRFGRDGSYAWWGSGQPLLAWERGVGWHREPLLRFVGESATSEAAQIDLTVTAPARDTVLASGTPDPPVAAGNGMRRWHSSADRARDVSVAVGPFVTKEATVGAVRLVVGTPAGSASDALLREHARAIRELSARFGPFPFPVLSVARLPIGGGGIEYPGSILMLDSGRLVAVHETAHQWFYGMVGDAQARDPWLDEAFATYAEALVDGSGGSGTATGSDSGGVLNQPGRVGGSMTDFGSDEAGYYRTVYDKGAAALLAARSAAGGARFDAALRCYINVNAWRIARPADLAAALRQLPAALAVLRKAGALPN